MLDFFLNARRALVSQWLRSLPVSELRKIAEERFEGRRFQSACFLGEVVQSGRCLGFPEFVFDADFVSLLKKPERALKALSGAKGCACFLPPEAGILNLEAPSMSTVIEFLSVVPSDMPCIRTGFLSTEFDVWESIALGFNGLCIHARHLDLFEIQFFTEICRDFKMSLVAIAESRETLSRIIESDCPYVGLWGYNVNTFAPDFAALSKMASKVPSTCLKVAFLSGDSHSEVEMLSKMHVSVAF
jgi:hypothetical protein